MADQTRTKTRIYELTETTTLTSDMNLAVDTEEGGTKRVQLSTLIDSELNTEGKAADSKAVGDALAGKVDKEAGKGLSEANFTSTEKTKLAGIQEGAAAVDATLAVTGKAADAKKTGDEITHLKQDISELETHLSYAYDALNLYVPQTASGVSPANSQANKILEPIELVSGHSYTYSIKYATASDAVSYVYLIDENVNVISSFTVTAGTTEKSQTFTATNNVSNCALAINSAGRALAYEVTFTDNSAPQETYIEELQDDVSEIRSEITELYTAHLELENIGSTANLEMTSSALVKPADDQPKRICIYFPCVQGVKYTVDKKYKTQYFRLGFTSVKPANGVSIADYQVLESNFNWISFVASQNGYAVMKIYQEGVDTSGYNDVLTSCVAYEGDYNSTVTQASEKVKDLNGCVFYCGHNRTLNTLKSGIEEATKYMDSILYVDAGEYDLVQEFGSTWFNSLTADDTMSGLVLKNRIHVVFSPNSKVISHYSGSNQYALSLYSPFNAGEYGFTLENLNLDCSRCRYAVHDERNSNIEQYKSEYINCKMKIDNSNNSAWTARHCIGGGLGTNAEIIIKNCLFESDNSADRSAVYYHIPNVATDDYRSIITIKDNYFITGCVTLDDVSGTPASDSDNSEYLITNNSYPVKYSGTDSEGVYNGLTKSANVRAWNNTFRS